MAQRIKLGALICQFMRQVVQRRGIKIEPGCQLRELAVGPKLDSLHCPLTGSCCTPDSYSSPSKAYGAGNYQRKSHHRRESIGPTLDAQAAFLGVGPQDLDAFDSMCDEWKSGTCATPTGTTSWCAKSPVKRDLDSIVPAVRLDRDLLPRLRVGTNGSTERHQAHSGSSPGSDTSDTSDSDSSDSSTSDSDSDDPGRRLKIRSSVELARCPLVHPVVNAGIIRRHGSKRARKILQSIPCHHLRDAVLLWAQMQFKDMFSDCQLPGVVCSLNSPLHVDSSARESCRAALFS